MTKHHLEILIDGFEGEDTCFDKEDELLLNELDLLIDELDHDDENDYEIGQVNKLNSLIVVLMKKK